MTNHCVQDSKVQISQLMIPNHANPEGNVVVAKASINYTGKTSMEVGVKVEAECLTTGEKTHVASAYLTFVALNEEGKPIDIPQIHPESPDEKRRYNEAKKRREERKKKIPKNA